MASGQRSARTTRSGPKISRRAAAACPRPAPVGTVAGHHDLAEHRLERRQHRRDVLVGHHPEHPDQEVEVELGGQPSASAAAPAGLWAASMNTVARYASAPTALAGGGGEACAHRVDVELALGPAPKNASTAASASAGVLRLVLAVQRQEHVGVHAAEAPAVPAAGRRRPPAGQHRELPSLPAPPRRRPAPPGPAAPPSPRAAWRPITATVSTGTSSPRGAPMMPAFSAAIRRSSRRGTRRGRRRSG